MLYKKHNEKFNKRAYIAVPKPAISTFLRLLKIELFIIEEEVLIDFD